MAFPLLKMSSIFPKKTGGYKKTGGQGIEDSEPGCEKNRIETLRFLLPLNALVPGMPGVVGKWNKQIHFPGDSRDILSCKGFRGDKPGERCNKAIHVVGRVPGCPAGDLFI